MKRTLKKIIDYAIGISEPEMIILFGSMATGKANVYSDVDLLIITDNIFIKKDIIAMVKSFSNELSLKADVLVYTRSEVEREVKEPNSFIAAIVKSGKVVYEKS